MRRFDDLSEREILALAIGAEEEDGRIYADFAEQLRETYPDSANIFTEMSAEENEHRRSLIDLYAEKFGQHIPLIRRQDVRGFVQRRPIWQLKTLGIETVREEARQMEFESGRFYRAAAARSSDAAIRRLLGDLAEIEDYHERTAGNIQQRNLAGGKREAEDEIAERRFILQVVQPGLVGLMDGSVSTLAPVFAAAFATHHSEAAFLVGLAAALGAGISMGFAEALSDDGKISGRGSPLLRGGITGMMTALGGIGHTMPYLLKNFYSATSLAVAVVTVELFVISWIRWKYMDSHFGTAIVQVVFGGALVLACGMLIGSA
jgi:rubrerythrin